MVDMAAIAGVASSLKVAADLTKAMIGLRDAEVMRAKVIELQSAILAAQQSAFDANGAQSALIEEVRDLKRQVADLEAWATEKQRYQLTEVGTGTFAYVVKASMRGAEPVHCICSECYQRGEKSILQITANTYGAVTLRCPRCKTDFFASEDHAGYPLIREYAEDPKEKARGRLEDCPLCLSGKLIVRGVKPHHIFGAVGGLQVRELVCDNPDCGHSEERDYDPNKATK